ncbi:hypothetical protein BOFE_10140 (plasmid) [Candidatus Borrelia fainii]|uniref:Uncharacterized protein n=2 Tax=Candidatus Borrelia fainii TaxID=2518322 RepID=A0ABN6UST2_9SPIR|nr:hypothetical protein BOFE_10140 [Candidatus Borrelia fainii]
MPMHGVKNLILISLHLFIIHAHAWGEKFNNENIKPLQIGIIQHNYINLTPYNQHYKYYAFIGITMTYNEWIDFNIIPINFYPQNSTSFSNVYFTLSISFYILKYQIHIYSFIINILVGTQLPISLRTSIITGGNNISAFLFPSLPFVSLKLNIPITNLFSILSIFSSSLREYFLVDIAISFPI